MIDSHISEKPVNPAECSPLLSSSKGDEGPKRKQRRDNMPQQPKKLKPNASVQSNEIVELELNERIEPEEVIQNMTGEDVICSTKKFKVYSHLFDSN